MATTGAAVVLRVVIGEDDVLLREGVARLLTDAGPSGVGRKDPVPPTDHDALR